MEREPFPGRQLSVSLASLRLEVTWENGSWHSGSRGFADTEEVTGSNPVAPTIVLLNRAFADPAVPLMPGGAGVSGRRAIPCLTNVFIGASEMAEGSLPTNASAPSGGDPGPRRPMALRTEPTDPCGSAQNRRNSTQDFGLAATPHCSPQKNWAERTARWRWPFGTWRGMTRLSSPRSSIDRQGEGRESTGGAVPAST